MAPEEDETQNGNANNKSDGRNSTAQNKSGHEKIGGLSFLDILRMLGGLILLNTVLSYFITGDSILWGYRPWWTRTGPLQTLLARLLPSHPFLH